MVELTIGMATYKDFDGVYFTLQALRLYHDLRDTELVVIDNYGCEHTKDLVEGWLQARYVLATDVVGTAASRDLLFREANGAAVLCCDSHVLFVPDAIARLKAYYREHPGCIDLLQGPLLYDDARLVSTHFEPEWQAEMWGTWATDPRGEDPDGEPFDIPMQGLGAFSCRKSAWPGFNPRFRGFGGEEGYIHEKFRQAGGRCLCLPWFRWMHRFGRPSGVPYPLTVEDKLRNYLIGHAELGLDLGPVLNHFAEILGEDQVRAVAEDVLAEPHSIDEDGEAASAVMPAVADAGAGEKRKDKKRKRNGKGERISIGGAPRHGSHVMGLADRTSAVHGQEVGEIDRDLTDDLLEARSSASNRPLNGRVHDNQPTSRRAIVCFVEDDRHLIQQLLALRHSWLYAESGDTDLVVMGSADVLARFPDDLVKIEQRPVADDPVWRGHRYVNAIACMNGAGAEQLDRYSHVLWTHVDTFITPAWKRFHPAVFTFGIGGYSNDDDIRQRIRTIAARYGLIHRGLTNVGPTWYGPTEVVRRACAYSEMLTKHLLSHHFADDEGAWPGWWAGAASLYAGEIAVNHCAPDGQRSDLLDAWSTLAEPISRYPHIHCCHTTDTFSKQRFSSGRYPLTDAHGLDINLVRDYCLEMSFRSLNDREPSRLVAAMPSAVWVGEDAREAIAEPRDSNAHLPLVSCICTTYNRPPNHQHLLEEAIESFLRQTYPNKELIVINDSPGQELLCDAPGVRVINLTERFPTLGDKCNAAVGLARGELIALWDDDDISLPWRLSLSVERLGDADYFNPRCYWFRDNDGLHFDHAVGYAHNASVFTRAAFELVGGYPSISLGIDAVMDSALLATMDRVVDPHHRGASDLTRDEWFYIYRWGVSPVHVSGRVTPEDPEAHYREIGTLPVQPGRYRLDPHWRMDYEAETRRVLDAVAAAVACASV